MGAKSGGTVRYRARLRALNPPLSRALPGGFAGRVFQDDAGGGQLPADAIGFGEILGLARGGPLGEEFVDGVIT